MLRMFGICIKIEIGVLYLQSTQAIAKITREITQTLQLSTKLLWYTSSSFQPVIQILNTKFREVFPGHPLLSKYTNLDLRNLIQCACAAGHVRFRMRILYQHVLRAKMAELHAVYTCPLCKMFSSRDYRERLSHIGQVHRNDFLFIVTCGYNGCSETKRSYSALYRV